MPEAMQYEKLYGIHPVTEALLGQRRRIQRVLIDARRRGAGITRITDLASQRRVPVEAVAGAVLRRLLGHQSHQGVVALAAPLQPLALAEFLSHLARVTGAQTLLLLDGVSDVGNFAALLRAAVAFGVDAVLLPRHRSVALTPTVAKRSAGAAEHIAVVQVDNVVRALAALQRIGFWVYGAERRASMAVGEVHWPERVVLVLGGEERGVRRLVKEHCDRLVGIPMCTSIDSLNVAVAGAIIMARIWEGRQPRPGT